MMRKPRTFSMHSRSIADRRQIALRLSLEQGHYLDQAANLWGCSRAAYIRRLLQEDLNRHHGKKPAVKG